MKIGWLTDIHLNFVDHSTIASLIATVQSSCAEAVLIGGDIAEAPTFESFLTELLSKLARPIYYVLGNHDFYNGSIARVHETARELQNKHPQLQWLTESSPVYLTERTALIGDGGWGDARAGNWDSSEIFLNDYLLINELRKVAFPGPIQMDRFQSCGEFVALRDLLRLRGEESARNLHRMLEAVGDSREHILVLMHVPPFLEACWHAGKLSDDNWAPHFVCVAAGEVLQEWMQQHPRQRMTVLCGHTHGAGEAQLLPNLKVITGGAEYTRPALQPLLDV